ncbi:MAG: PASTA domain-containing protein [Ignavibacteriales bacterium]|nr:PASTA domain-containing protein [Ignavibacteriales bacterium]
MKLSKNTKKLIKSSLAKKLFLILGVILILFFLFNDLLMNWYVEGGGISVVPNVAGMKYDEAVRMLDSLGFEPKKGDVRLDRDKPADIVISQNPSEGMTVKTGRRIYMVVSAGEITVTVPNIKGRTIRDAQFQLEREGLKLGSLDYQYSEEFPSGTIISQKTNPGVKVKRDISISCIVSQGVDDGSVQVPDVTGKQLSEAERILQSIGLIIGNITYIPSNDLLPNTVVDQYPRLGEKSLPNKKVDLIVIQSGEKKESFREN